MHHAPGWTQKPGPMSSLGLADAQQYLSNFHPAQPSHRRNCRYSLLQLLSPGIQNFLSALRLPKLAVQAGKVQCYLKKCIFLMFQYFAFSNNNIFKFLILLKHTHSTFLSWYGANPSADIWERPIKKKIPIVEHIKFKPLQTTLTAAIKEWKQIYRKSKNHHKITFISLFCLLL